MIVTCPPAGDLPWRAKIVGQYDPHDPLKSRVRWYRSPPSCTTTPLRTFFRGEACDSHYVAILNIGCFRSSGAQRLAGHQVANHQVTFAPASFTCELHDTCITSHADLTRYQGKLATMQRIFMFSVITEKIFGCRIVC